MKKLLILKVFVGLVVFAMCGQVAAYDINDTTNINISEYALYGGNVVGTPTELGVAGNPGYFLWATDESRRDWYFAWQGDGSTDSWYEFDGHVYLSSESDGNSLSGVMSVGAIENSDWVFEGNDELVTNYNDQIDTEGWADIGIDAVKFSIVGNSLPSYLAFDLRMNEWFVNDNGQETYKGYAGASMAPYINIGEFNETSGEEDFKIAAPVPEPATILLFGAGLLGLAAYGRKRGFRRG